MSEFAKSFVALDFIGRIVLYLLIEHCKTKKLPRKFYKQTIDDIKKEVTKEVKNSKSQYNAEIYNAIESVMKDLKKGEKELPERNEK